MKKPYNDFSRRNGSIGNDWVGMGMAVMVGIALAIIIGEFIWGDGLTAWFLAS